MDSGKDSGPQWSKSSVIRDESDDSEIEVKTSSDKFEGQNERPKVDCTHLQAGCSEVDACFRDAKNPKRRVTSFKPFELPTSEKNKTKRRILIRRFFKVKSRNKRKPPSEAEEGQSKHVSELAPAHAIDQHALRITHPREMQIKMGMIEQRQWDEKDFTKKHVDDFVSSKKETAINTGQEATGMTILIASLVLEAISAIFDQLGNALMGMTVASLALLLSVGDLIYKARKQRVRLVRQSCLPLFYSHSSHDHPSGKLFGSAMDFFGLGSALWQCFYSTIQYIYALQNRNNPINFCLLPFLFVLCMFISKLIRPAHWAQRRPIPD